MKGMLHTRRGRIILVITALFIIASIATAAKKLGPETAKQYTRTMGKLGGLAIGVLSLFMMAWRGPWWIAGAVAVGALHATGAWNLGADMLGLPMLPETGGGRGTQPRTEAECRAAGCVWSCSPGADGRTTCGCLCLSR